MAVQAALGPCCPAWVVGAASFNPNPDQNMRRIFTIVLCFILLCLTFVSCKTPEGTYESPVVGYSSFEGKGSVYTDGDTVVAWGACEGTAGVMVKGVWMPVVVPFMVTEDAVFVGSLSRNSQEMYERGDPLPLWCKTVLPESVIQAEAFTFKTPPPYQGPGDVVPKSP
jgi:hypothetical protein